MYMVVILHVLSTSGALDAFAPLSVNYEIAWFMETAAFCAVNCYALISGYVGVESNYKYSSIIKLWIRVFFYSAIIEIIFYIATSGVTGKTELFKSFLPVLEQRYWYFTAYFGMFLLIPLLNVAIKKVSKTHMKVLLLFMLIFCSIFPILHHDIIRVVSGYNMTWLCIMYIVGAYIREYHIEEKLSKGKCFLAYMLCIVLTWAYRLLSDSVTIKISYLNDPEWLLYYVSPTIVFAAIFLLMGFSQLKIKEKSAKIIAKITPLVFSVYLIHTNIRIFDIVLPRALNFISGVNTAVFPLVVLACAALIFVVCIFIDSIREWLFKHSGINKLAEKVDKIKV